MCLAGNLTFGWPVSAGAEVTCSSVYTKNYPCDSAVNERSDAGLGGTCIDSCILRYMILSYGGWGVVVGVVMLVLSSFYPPNSLHL